MALVFPKAKPIGVNSSSSREAIRDSAAFPTKVIDYLKFDIFDQKSNTIKSEGPIYLYLPTSLQEQQAKQISKQYKFLFQFKLDLPSFLKNGIVHRVPHFNIIFKCHVRNCVPVRNMYIGKF